MWLQWTLTTDSFLYIFFKRYKFNEMHFSDCPIKIEGHCSVEGFKLVADILPMDELVYPIPEEDLENAKGFAGE